MNGSDRQQAGVQSIETAGQILKVMADLQRPGTLGEIARSANLHPAKAHRYLVSLVRTGLVEQDVERGRYAPGSLAMTLGLMRLRRLDFMACAAPHLATLRDTTGETSLLVMWSAQGPVVLKQEDGARPIFLNIRVGSILPLRLSASGLVFAAYLPLERYRGLLEEEAGVTEVEIERFLASAAIVRTAGFGQVDGSVVPGVRALAAPLFDSDGSIAAVIGLLGRDADLDGSTSSPAARALLSTADRISRTLGAPPR